jgi:hypothetical protein
MLGLLTKSRITRYEDPFQNELDEHEYEMENYVRSIVDDIFCEISDTVNINLVFAFLLG